MKKLNCIILVIMLLPTFCLATGVPTPAVIADNAGLFQWVLGLALLGNGFFIARLLKSHDRQWKELGKQGKSIAYIAGATGVKVPEEE